MSDIYDILDNLSARGQRLQGQLPGDYKPVGPADPAADVLAKVYSLILSWPAVEPDAPVEGEAG